MRTPCLPWWYQRDKVNSRHAMQPLLCMWHSLAGGGCQSRQCMAQQVSDGVVLSF
jgi:hypothetical protein